MAEDLQGELSSLGAATGSSGNPILECRISVQDAGGAGDTSHADVDGTINDRPGKKVDHAERLQRLSGERSSVGLVLLLFFIILTEPALKIDRSMAPTNRIDDMGLSMNTGLERPLGGSGILIYVKDNLPAVMATRHYCAEGIARVISTWIIVRLISHCG